MTRGRKKYKKELIYTAVVTRVAAATGPALIRLTGGLVRLYVSAVSKDRVFACKPSHGAASAA